MKSSNTEERLRIEQQAAKWFARSHAHDHTPQERAGLNAWLAEDAEHSKVYWEMEMIWNLLGKFADRPEMKALILKVQREAGII